MPSLPADVDHLILGTPDLGTGIAFLQGRLGVTAVIGGSHPRWGTRNALLGLGHGVYLEILAPDPEASRPDAFGLATLPEPRLVTWVMKESRLEARRAQAQAVNVVLGAICEGFRTRPDGTTLSWRFTDPLPLPLEGLVPFFIDWGDSPHPSTTAPAAGRLISLSAEHPSPEAPRRVLRSLHLPLDVVRGSSPRLVARIETRHGVITLE